MTIAIVPEGISRRSLLASTSVYLFSVSAGAATIGQGMPWSPGTATPPTPVRPGTWMFFSAGEASAIEAAVDRLIPADERRPRGKEARLQVSAANWRVHHRFNMAAFAPFCVERIE